MNDVIIGFGFGNPVQSVLMLLLTSFVSFVIIRSLRNLVIKKRDPNYERQRLREYYYEQRRKAREYAREFDLTDEEIERRVEKELRLRS